MRSKACPARVVGGFAAASTEVGMQFTMLWLFCSSYACGLPMSCKQQDDLHDGFTVHMLVHVSVSAHHKSDAAAVQLGCCNFSCRVSQGYRGSCQISLCNFPGVVRAVTGCYWLHEAMHNYILAQDRLTAHAVVCANNWFNTGARQPWGVMGSGCRRAYDAPCGPQPSRQRT